MIRINLLGTPKPKKASWQPAIAVVSSGSGEGFGSTLVAIVIVLVITAAANGFYYMKLTRDAVRLQKEIAAANADYARLTQVKLRYQELEKQKDAYKKRVDVIDELQAKQSGPLNLLNLLGDTVNRTDEIWLSHMTETSSNITLQGTALSVHAVADLMRNLQNTGYFKAVDIKSSYQDEAVKDMQAFVFELNCEKRLSSVPSAPPAAPAAGKKS
jgi:Tfp pilus assembly protein PilN